LNAEDHFTIFKAENDFVSIVKVERFPKSDGNHNAASLVHSQPNFVSHEVSPFALSSKAHSHKRIIGSRSRLTHSQP